MTMILVSDPIPIKNLPNYLRTSKTEDKDEFQKYHKQLALVVFLTVPHFVQTSSVSKHPSTKKGTQHIHVPNMSSVVAHVKVTQPGVFFK
jgi:hypothetical protein